MFKVLLVSGQPDVRDAFESFEDWEALGFEPPRIVVTAKEAVLLIESGVVDAVAYVLPKEEGQAFFSFLAEHPEIRCMEAATDSLRLRRVLGSLRRALHERSGVDTLTDVLPILQTEFFHNLLEGTAQESEELRARIAALQIQVALESPVCVAHLRLPQGEIYLEEVWRYGRARLEIALRNFFERDLPDLRFVLNVLTPQEIKLLASPKLYIDAQTLGQRMREQLTRACGEIMEYLELEVKVLSLYQYENLLALCANRQSIGEQIQ